MPDDAPVIKPTARTKNASFRLTDDDRRILAELSERHGLEATNVVRMALRALHGAKIVLPKKLD